MKKILITGGSGYLGTSLALNLKKKYKVYLGSRNNYLNSKVQDLTKCETFPLDITNINSVKDIINRTKPNIIIHAAASKYVDISEINPNECIDTNVLGSQNIARVAIDNKLDSVIGISTDKAAPPYSNIYGLTKSLMERLFSKLAFQSKTKFSCVRFGNIVWSTGSVFPVWTKMMNKNNIIYSTGPNMRRFFFTVKEACTLVETAINEIKYLNGKILISKMKSAKIEDILNIWCDIFNSKWKKIANREGDKIDENLIGLSEVSNAFIHKFKKKEYILLDYKKNNCRDFKDSVSSKNSAKLSNKEIKDLILSK